MCNFAYLYLIKVFYTATNFCFLILFLFLVIGGITLHAAAHGSVATLPQHTVLLFHVRCLGVTVETQITV